jgi:hypothetical protein
MLPIYQAINFKTILEGGSTKPWLVLVSKNQLPERFVVKLYKSEYVTRHFTIAKDVYSSVLASEFGIRTPLPALIELNNIFKEKLPIKVKQHLTGKHSGITFGTQMIHPAFPYQEEMPRQHIWKYDIETIYAFDNLIKNGDRRIGKPNLLMKSREMYVIDHEHAFAVNAKTLEHFEQNTWVYWKDRHIFYKYLRDRGVESKRRFFGNFLQLLMGIDMDVLDPYHEQLVALGLDDEANYYQIKEYLCYMQRNAEKLVQLLIGELA